MDPIDLTENACKLLLLPLYPLAYIYKLYRTVFPHPVPVLPHLLTAKGYSQVWRVLTKLHEERIHNCEDLVIWERHRVAILSTESSRAIFNPFTGEGSHSEADNGKLQVYHLDSSALQGIKIIDWPDDRALHPLGINLLERRGDALLGIANCPEGPCSIELLQLSFNADFQLVTARYLKTFEHRGIASPNAVVVLSEGRALFTNSFGISPRTSRFLSTIEQSIAAPGGSLRLVTSARNGNVTCRTLISGIPLANGLALSSDGKILVIASTMGQFVSVYDVLDDQNGISSSRQLKHREDVPVGFLADNLHFVEHREKPFGSGGETASYILLCAGHPSAFEYLETARHPLTAPKSPSRVIKIAIEASRPETPGLIAAGKAMFTPQGSGVTRIFESRGGFFGTSSTAAAYRTREGGNAMLVCGLWQDGLLRCEDVQI